MKPHVAIPAMNLHQSKAFYAGLGFVVEQEWQRPEWKLIGCFMSHPCGLTIELLVNEKNTSIKFPAVAEVLHIAIPVNNLDEIVVGLIAAGVPIVRPITSGITVKRLAFIKDPNGFTVELYEPK